MHVMLFRISIAGVLVQMHSTDEPTSHPARRSSSQRPGSESSLQLTMVVDVTDKLASSNTTIVFSGLHRLPHPASEALTVVNRTENKNWSEQQARLCDIYLKTPKVFLYGNSDIFCLKTVNSGLFKLSPVLSAVFLTFRTSC